MTRLFHPMTDKLRAARDALLTRALRPEGAPYAIAREYPLVLSSDGARFSYCFADESGAIAAHANLWPRDLIAADGSVIRIGLVGNVATDERLRGKGLMSTLLRALETKAQTMGLKALLLWSDLEGFYQKQGYWSCGREYRLMIGREAMPERSGFRVESDPERLDLARLLSLRPQLAATLRRSPSEFAALLRIPATLLVAGASAYAVIGKGCDMQGVAHEWGGAWGDVLAACRVGCDALELKGLMVLSPDPRSGGEQHRMCWAKALGAKDDDLAALRDAFIWGLDSI